MRFFGLIPARGGSKGVPLKSIAPCAGRPLLTYTCEAALGCKAIERTALSTDSEEIAEVGKALGAEVPFLRPPELAGDETPMLPVLRHFIDNCAYLPGAGDKDGYALVLLQPTSPLRTSLHLDDAIAHFLAGQTRGAESLVSVVKVPHQYNPVSIMRMDGSGLLTSYQDDAAAILRRQDKPRVYARNGPAIVITTPALIRSGRLYGDIHLGYEMDARSSLDVDDQDDLEMAELLLNTRGDSRA